MIENANTEVMRITKDGVWVNPDIPVEETAKAVLDALSSQVKVLVQRAVEDERETIIKWLIDEGFFVKDGPLTEAIRARGEKPPVKSYCGGVPNYCTPEVPCKTHPQAPHGFDRNASHSADRYVCECEGWEPVDAVNMTPDRVDKTAKDRLIRIMGTFDLATGHADNWDELLDSLESELRDVLGHLRARREWVGLADYTNQATNGRMRIDPVTGDVSIGTPSTPAPVWDASAPLVMTQHPAFQQPLKREWVGLTDAQVEEIAEYHGIDGLYETSRIDFYRAIEITLKEKNVPQP